MIGPQKQPASAARIDAQTKQVRRQMHDFNVSGTLNGKPLTEGDRHVMNEIFQRYALGPVTSQENDALRKMAMECELETSVDWNAFFDGVMVSSCQFRSDDSEYLMPMKLTVEGEKYVQDNWSKIFGGSK